MIHDSQGERICARRSKDRLLKSGSCDGHAVDGRLRNIQLTDSRITGLAGNVDIQTGSVGHEDGRLIYRKDREYDIGQVQIDTPADTARDVRLLYDERIQSDIIERDVDATALSAGNVQFVDADSIKCQV